MAKRKDDSIRFRIKATDKIKLQAIADQEEATVSELIRSLIQAKCRKIKLNQITNFTTIEHR